MSDDLRAAAVAALAEAFVAATPGNKHGQLCPVWTQRRRATTDPCNCFVSERAPQRAVSVLDALLAVPDRARALIAALLTEETLADAVHASHFGGRHLSMTDAEADQWLAAAILAALRAMDGLDVAMLKDIARAALATPDPT